MDTYLIPRNEHIVREREDALRAARERSRALARATVAEPDDAEAARVAGIDVPTAEAPKARRRGSELDLLVVTLFAVLAAGFVSLVVTSLQIG